MNIAFQLRCPGVNFDLSHAGKGQIPWLVLFFLL